MSKQFRQGFAWWEGQHICNWFKSLWLDKHIHYLGNGCTSLTFNIRVILTWVSWFIRKKNSKRFWVHKVMMSEMAWLLPRIIVKESSFLGSLELRSSMRKQLIVTWFSSGSSLKTLISVWLSSGKSSTKCVGWWEFWMLNQVSSLRWNSDWYMCLHY